MSLKHGDSGDNNDSGPTANDTEWKILSIITIYFVAIAFGVLPIALRHKFSEVSAYATGLGYANAFAAGVFLSMGLIHLLPEGAEKMKDYYGKETDSKYHLCYLMCAVGYTCILTLERVVFTTPTCVHHIPETAPVGEKQPLLGSSHCSQSVSYHEGSNAVLNLSNPNFSNPHFVTVTADSAAPGSVSSRSERIVSGLTAVSRTPAESASHAGEFIPSEKEEYGYGQKRSYTDEQGAGWQDNHGQGNDGGHGHAHGTDNKHPDADTLNALTPYVLMAALGAHGLSEGLALGVETGSHGIILLLFAILAHKWAEGLALGISFSKSSVPVRRILMLLCAFSLSTPMGIGIGWLAQSFLPPSVEGYFLGFSSGSFLYIGASEVVVEEFVQGKRQWGKLFFFILGITVIYCVTAFADFD